MCQPVLTCSCPLMCEICTLRSGNGLGKGDHIAESTTSSEKESLGRLELMTFRQDHVGQHALTTSPCDQLVALEVGLNDSEMENTVMVVWGWLADANKVNIVMGA